jgi:hypothetical protein
VCRPVSSDRKQKTATSTSSSNSKRADKYFSIGVNGVVKGTPKTVGEKHISYFLRQWEVNEVTLHDRASTDKNNNNVRTALLDKAELLAATDEKPPGFIYSIANPFFSHRYGSEFPAYSVVLVFLLVFFTLPLILTNVDAISTTCVALFIAHLVTYLIVFWSTGFALYASYSCIDGLNTITRFTVKLPSADPELRTFLESNFPSSISSSVSTRGSTLNKLMIGVSFSLGLGLFLKFIQYGQIIEKIIAFGYLTIVATAMYENRTFVLDDCDPKILHHRMDKKELMARSESPLALIEEKTSPVYLGFHSLGVFAFVAVSFAGFTYNHAQMTENEFPVWGISCAGLILAIIFVAYNAILNEKPTSSKSGWKLKFKAIHSGLNGPVAPNTNRTRGLTCITIEILALALSALAGVLYRRN